MEKGSAWRDRLEIVLGALVLLSFAMLFTALLLTLLTQGSSSEFVGTLVLFVICLSLIVGTPSGMALIILSRRKKE